MSNHAFDDPDWLGFWGDPLVALVAALPDVDCEMLTGTSRGWPWEAWCATDLRVGWGTPFDPAVGSQAVAALRSSLLGDFSAAVVPWEEKEPVEPACSPEAPLGKGGLRLRRRGVFAKTLEQVVASSIWWSDLVKTSDTSPARAWLDSYFGESGVKACGKAKKLSVGEDGAASLWVVQVPFSSESGSRLLWTSPDLLAALVAVRVFRPVSEGLVASLRSRARLWAEGKGMSVLDLVRILPGTLALACLPMPDEVLAIGALRGQAARWSADVLGAFGRGVLKEPTWARNSWRSVFHSWVGGEALPAPTKPSIPALRVPA